MLRHLSGACGQPGDAVWAFLLNCESSLAALECPGCEFGVTKKIVLLLNRLNHAKLSKKSLHLSDFMFGLFLKFLGLLVE